MAFAFLEASKLEVLRAASGSGSVAEVAQSFDLHASSGPFAAMLLKVQRDLRLSPHGSRHKRPRLDSHDSPSSRSQGPRQLFRSANPNPSPSTQRFQASSPSGQRVPQIPGREGFSGCHRCGGGHLARDCTISATA